jgi:hypothetical protein
MMTNDAITAISELDLDPIKFKLMHAESGEGWSQEKADAMEVEYRRFLYLMKVFPDDETAPTVEVDIFWHYHILDTMKYAKDCEHAFGYFLHHYPYVGMGGTAQDTQQRQDSATRMRELYESTFGEAYGARSAAWCTRAADTAAIAEEGETAAEAASATAAWCTRTNADAARAAWCTRAATPQAQAAWCTRATAGQADAAWCTRATAPQAQAAWCTRATAPQAQAAWCTRASAGLADTAWCTRATATQAQDAWCTRATATQTQAQAQDAWCTRASAPATQAAWCTRAAAPEAQAAWCTRTNGEKVNAAWCTKAMPAAVQSAWCTRIGNGPALAAAAPVPSIGAGARQAA